MGAMDFPWWALGLFVMFTGISLMAIDFSFIISLAVTITGVMLVILYKIFAPKYPVPVEIMLVRNGVARRLIDNAARLQDRDGTYRYRFKKLKDETLPIAYESLFSTAKGDIAYFFSPAAGQYHPMTIGEYEKVVEKVVRVPDKFHPGEFVDEVVKETVTPFKIIPEDLKHWHVLTHRRNRFKYLNMSAWERFYPLIVFAIVGVIILILIVSLFNGMNPLMDKASAAADSFARSAEANTRLVDELVKRFPINESLISNPTIPKPPDVV